MLRLWCSILIFCILCLFSVKKSNAQDAPVYEQYVFDNTLLNPAFTGLVDIIQVKAAHRQQWIGYGQRNAPSTTFLMFRSRIKDRDGGLGGFLYTDRNGVNSQTGLQVNGSFQFLMLTHSPSVIPKVAFCRGVLSSSSTLFIFNVPVFIL